jgi:hypothetical protein
MNHYYVRLQGQEIGEPLKTIYSVISDTIAFIGKVLHSVYLMLIRIGGSLTEIEKKIGLLMAKLLSLLGTLAGIKVKLCIKVMEMVIKMMMKMMESLGGVIMSGMGGM